MPSFRSSKSQAARAITSKIALGKGRHDSKDDNKIHSVATARNYQVALTGFADYLKEHKIGYLQSATADMAMQYLVDRSVSVAQKTLDVDRQALQMHLGGVKLEVIKSERATHLSTRSYTPVQVQKVATAQTEKNSLPTRIAHYTGLRAHELLTIRPVAERPASTHRTWSTDRFAGREGVRYTVVGKGGLIREVLVPKDLAERLEARRLPEPRQVVDRLINYVQHYDIGGGQRLSQSFSAASQRAIGRSTGIHGLRHSYAQERMHELRVLGYSYKAAKAIVAQEVGHFSADTTEAYLR